MKTDLPIAFSPELGLDSADFVAAWNADAEAAALAQARLAPAGAQAYDPALLAAAAPILGGIALGVAGNAVYDLIKKALGRRGVPTERVRIAQVEQPDGSPLLVVTIVRD